MTEAEKKVEFKARLEAYVFCMETPDGCSAVFMEGSDHTLSQIVEEAYEVFVKNEKYQT